MQNHKMIQPFLSHCHTKISLDLVKDAKLSLTDQDKLNYGANI